MKLFSVLIVSFLLLSCSKRLLEPGRYKFDIDRSYIDIKTNNDYVFSSKKDFASFYAYSQGKIKIKVNTVFFIPDSSCFFNIQVSKYLLDTSLKNQRKIILNMSDSVFDRFHFQFAKYSSDTGIIFSNGKSVIYRPTESYHSGFMTLRAELNDSVVILPLPLHQSLTSNTIEFSDVNKDDPKDGPWNVLVLTVNINRNMFFFTTLSPFILHRNKLIKKDWPIYKLEK